MEIVSQIVGPVVKLLTDHIAKHLRYVTSFTKHNTDMNNKMKELEGAFDDVNRHMERNMMGNKEIPARVPEWLKEVDDIRRMKASVNGISTDVNGCLNIKKRYVVGKKAFKTFEEIETLVNEGEKFKWSDATIPFGRVDSKLASTSAPSATGEIAQNDFKSRDNVFKEALKFLQQDDKASQVIALCGMGGVGKTTMMKQLKKVAHDNKMFNFIVMLVIGQDPNISTLQNDLAFYIGDSDLPANVSTSLKEEYLCKKFEKLSQDKKKILIILDDVWGKIKLKDIGLTSPLPNGVKLFLTSRDSKYCIETVDATSVDLQVVRVDVLEEAEAQKFFSQIAGISEDDLDKYPIGCDIVKKCGCLPLAIKLIASTLKSKDNYQWTNALNRLNNNDLDKQVQKIIKISYEYIEDEEEKQLFLHCSLFPEDYEIPIEDLTRHAWGVKLLKNVSTLREARDRTNTCVHNLINANLLIIGNQIGCVKMHDLVLAFVLGEVSKGDGAWVIKHGDVSRWNKDIMGESCKRISVTCKGLSYFPRDFKCPNLSLLQLMDGDDSLKFQEDFYEHLKSLEVMAHYNMQYPLLPRSLQCSTNLNTLCLYKCKVMFDCSFIGDLVNLEVLSFAHCGIRKLPSALGNLRKLKLLDLTGCFDLRIDNGVFQYLENLEELYMTCYRASIRFTDAILEELVTISRQLCALEVEFVEKKTQLKNMCFKKLDKFKISMGCLLKRKKELKLLFHKEKEEDEHLLQNTLKLVTDKSSDLVDCKIHELFKKTEKLHLQVEDMTRLEDVISHHAYNRDSYFYLRDLVISDCTKLINLFPISVVDGLWKLERLIVSRCSVLEALVHSDGSEIKSVEEMIKFEKLKFLALKDLPKLVSLFHVENVVELPQLVELEFNGLPNFTSIFSDTNNEHVFLNSQVIISKLQTLSIYNMENLKQIWAVSSEELVNSISTLREVKVWSCDSLLNLFPSNPVRLLKYLERLTVERCNSIEVIFNIDLISVGQVELATNNSLKSITLIECEKVREVWWIKGGDHNNSTSISAFEAVERIQIERCKRFQNLFTPTNTKFDMRALTEITIKDCGESESDNESQLRDNERVDVVFEISNGEVQQQQMILFPCLKDLNLQDMERMTHVWKCDNWNKFVFLQKQHPQWSFHNLTTILISQCKRMKYLFSPLMATLLSNLEKIEIWNCEGIEEVVSNLDDNLDEEMSTSMRAHSTTDFFPHLRSLFFFGLKNLKRIGGGELKLSQGDVASWSLCQYPREILIIACDALSSLIPVYAVGQMQKLQLFNLKKLVISSCGLLQHVFTFSTLESLKHLEELKIMHSKSMKVVVKKENEEQNAKVVEFPHLISLELDDLPELEGFFLGKNDFQWPSLENVKIIECPKIMVFTSGRSTAPKLKYMHTSLGKHSLDLCGLNFHVKTNQLPSSESTRLPWFFHNLIELDMYKNHDRKTKCIIPSTELLQLQKLERIQVKDSWYVEGVFDEPQTVVEVPNLTKVELNELSNLKYIWKINHHHQRTGLEFPNLTTLSINNCRRLKHVCTSSMAGSLPQLQHLHISFCWDLKAVIVKEEDESESESDAKVKEIVLPSLKSLKLGHLEHLQGFCLREDNFSLPLLHNLEIRECPELTVFTKGHVNTPALNLIDTDFGRCHIREEEDINSFIKTKQQEGFRFYKMKRDC